MKKTIHLFKTGAMACGLLLTLAACNNSGNGQASNTDTTAASEQPEQQGPTDAQIASIAVAANQIDIGYAEIAQDKSSNDKVLGFAKTMAKDHQNIIDQAVDLVTKLGVTPDDDNKTTKSLMQEADKEKETLNGLSGDEFNKAYIDNEVKYHEQVIDAVQNVLIPNADNAKLKDLLESVVPLLKSHLDHAKSVQADLEGAS